MRLCVVGTGYVGLVAGAGFAETGNDVLCVDNDAAKIAALQRGEIPIYEPGLEELVERNARAGRLRFTTDLAGGVRHAQVVLVAVGTPSGPDGEADLGALWAVADGVAAALDGPRVVATKSTVPVGTAARLAARLAAASPHRCAVVSNPEFLKEGDAVNDFMKPARVVIGTDDAPAREVMRHLYAPFVRTRDRLLFMDATSAELTKYAANAFLATKVTFMNEMANLAEVVGADVEAVRVALGSDDRIGPRFLFPGVGFGGSCFPKDLRAVIATAREAGAPLSVVEAAYGANDRQKGRLVEKVRAHFHDALAGRVFGVWGLSFKPRTDDVREAPALETVTRLLAAGAAVRAHDPQALPTARAALGERARLSWHEDPYAAAEGADALLLCTEWNQYRSPDFERLRATMRGAVVFDGRNLWDPPALAALGFAYHGIGRPGCAK
ncbi:MAG TPA: UDP-glucose/GDP-mannose dehydrogenase family protein [Myxococcota bacterium]|jgi:UDPglucose 6-dehydrogenase|nr:UDP-glucose/GDP-mannose dehydrogenase family protein [Myxococcota bacterium]